MAAGMIWFFLYAEKAGRPEEVAEIVTHAQDTWERALEWCESRGLLEAVNPNDLDGTPSWYSWQWKPETFKSYGEKYLVIEPGLDAKTIKERMKQYKTQKLILDNMVNDPAIKWEHEFPGCVKKIGRPPKY